MLNAADFLCILKHHGVDFFTGVPDSLLASFCTLLDDEHPKNNHIIAANEGNAIATAIGFHLATGKLPAVYMQNSGLGNAINPLTSLADAEVYSVPMLLIIGWRGEPNSKDEPQHLKQGRITEKQLSTLEIPYWILDKETNHAAQISAACEIAIDTQAPVALVIRQNTFAPYTSKLQRQALSELEREACLRQILQLSKTDDLIISTTGKTSRELYELRNERNELQQDFLTVGGMGHTASIALGVALGSPNRRIICLDGDGSLIMHMGSMAIICQQQPQGFIHVLLNNAAHESVGGQPTAATTIDFSMLSKALGYVHYAKAETLSELSYHWQHIDNLKGPVFLEIRLKCGSRSNLSRPTSTPTENKIAFMEKVYGLQH